VKEALIDVVDRMFGGSVEALVMSLLKTKQLDPKKLRELNEIVIKRQQEDKNGDS
jgi:predicted transcriptional regulator